MGVDGAPCTIAAFDLAVQVPPERRDSVEMFDRLPGPPDVVLAEQVDEVAFTGDLTTQVLARTRLHCVHAGVVAGRHGAVVIPGPSNLGKSTLTVALVQAGFDYLSDEAAGLSVGDPMVHSFPRRPTLSAASLGLLGLAGSDGAGERAVTASELGRLGAPRADVAVIVLAERDAGGPFAIEQAPSSDAVAALIRNSFNHFRNPAASLQAYATLATQARVIRMRYPSAPEAALRLAEMFR